MDITRDKIRKILDSGANVVCTTKGIDDMAMKYLVEGGVFAIRRVDKKDMRRIAKCTGGQMILTLATLEGDEAFDPANLGHAEEVCEQQWVTMTFASLKDANKRRR